MGLSLPASIQELITFHLVNYNYNQVLRLLHIWQSWESVGRFNYFGANEIRIFDKNVVQKQIDFRLSSRQRVT